MGKNIIIYTTTLIMLIGIASLINVTAQAPQEAQIAFASDRDGNYEIYVMDADGNNPRRLTNNPAQDAYPNWFDPTERSVSSTGKLATTRGKIKAK
jgi:hypothetical protein